MRTTAISDPDALSLMGEPQRSGNSFTPPISAATLENLLVSCVRAVAPLLDAATREQLADLLLTAGGSAVPFSQSLSPQCITIGQLCSDYCVYATGYYPKRERTIANEASTIHYAVTPLRKLFGSLPAQAFGPRNLKAVREQMVEMGWCRSYINSQVGRIKRMFKWAVENELVRPEVLEALKAVPGLRYGRSSARESDPVKPVAEAHVTAVFPFVSRQVKAMIQLQWLTGMRSGEVCILRPCDVDQSQQPWLYRPLHHKTAHHRHERMIFLGPKAQAILAPFLSEKSADAFLFAPKDADRERRAQLHLRRKTPMSCGNRPGSNRKQRPRKSPSERYDPSSYARAITYACRLAFPPPPKLKHAEVLQWQQDHHWHPHQLRHSAATRLRREFGLDVAQVVLGHKTLEVTQVYAEKNVESARSIMMQAG